MNNRKLVTIGIMGSTAVALGALGAHFLKLNMQAGMITQDQLNGFDTGVRYQIYHTIAMLCLVLLSKQFHHKYLTWAYFAFLWGIILFSGSLYFLCTRNIWGANWLKVLGPVTPIGGLCFVAGWLFLALAGLRKSSI